jgi:hypothetical protein
MHVPQVWCDRKSSFYIVPNSEVREELNKPLIYWSIEGAPFFFVSCVWNDLGIPMMSPKQYAGCEYGVQSKAPFGCADKPAENTVGWFIMREKYYFGWKKQAEKDEL